MESNNRWAVAVERCPDYAPDAVRRALSNALDAVGGLSFVRPGMRIAVKANLLMPAHPDKAATVHPSVAVALCELLTKRGASVVLGDSPGGPFTAAYLNTVYGSTGMRQILETGATLNADYSILDVDAPDAVEAKRFSGTRYLFEADAVISLCKIKTHGLMAYTGACKNFFGAIPGLRKPEYHYQYNTHERFASMLVDVTERVAPVLSVADAVVAMEGNGPSGGTPRNIGAILVSKSPHALDLAASHLMTLSPDDVPTLREAIRRGLIPDSVAGLAVHGDLESLVVPDFVLVPKHGVEKWGFGNEATARFLARLLAQRPIVDTKMCVRCGECAKLCPAKAIRVDQTSAKIARGRCIRCFCCQEFCPRGAITVGRAPFARLINR